MSNWSRRVKTKWLVGIVLVLCLSLLGAQSSSMQELSELYALGDIPLDPVTYQGYLKVRQEAFAYELPESYDARAFNWVTSAKNQGSCGSCWAFASVGAMESHLMKQYDYGLTTDLSEQQQVSCNNSMSGCCGGSSSAPRFWEDTGPVEESCFPYGDGGTSCPTQSNVPCSNGASCEQLPYRVIDWHTVPTTQAGFKTSLQQDGPSYWRYLVYSDFYTYWNSAGQGAVYTNQGGTLQGGHAVLLIGWDDTKGAYLCKNSWGANGGPNEDGTFWIAYEGHYHSLGFGMSNFSLTAVGCNSDAECDDGLYCNGAETCVDQVCQPGTPPCTDDGLFCNGSETCDEATDTCGHTGSPCEEGTVCDEDADLCRPDTCPNGTCDAGEDCNSCPDDCISGSGGGTCEACFKGVCNGECHPVKEGPDCADCAPSWCCGDGDCTGDEDSFNCAVDCGAPPVCGDDNCDPDEDQCNCPADCGTPPANETGLCSNGVDDDCDTFTDCDDSDCSADPACVCGQKGDPCNEDSECCNNKCRGGKCR
jgi:C1A family cysteine protease